MTKMTNGWRRLILILGTVLCILTSCHMPKPDKDEVIPGNDNTVTPPAKIDTEEPVDTPPPPQVLSEVPEKPLTLPTIIPNQQDVQSSTNTPTTAKPAAPQVTEPPKSSSDSASKINASLHAYAVQAQAYYNKNVDAEGLISRGGKLYNSKGTPINATYIDENTDVSSPLANFGCDILLIKASDLAQYEGAKVYADNTAIGVFTAIKVSGNNKIMLANSEGSAGSITLEDYRLLLRSYSQNHGEIGSPVAGSEEYERILNFLRVHEGVYGSYFVRDMRQDQKYTIVTLSPKTNPLDIRQYILVNDNSFWEVAMSGLEKEYYIATAVNQALPDFNLSMLPPYNIASSKNNLKADNSNIFKLLVYNGLIESETQVYYACGTTDYCYIVLYDNTKFLAMRSGQNWKIESVPSSLAAHNILKDDAGQSSSFIILDNDKAVE